MAPARDQGVNPPSSEGFYAGLPLLTAFEDITRAENFAPLPGDWHVAMCDVRNSTKAVESGQYKNVNTVGASAITAVLNAAGAVEIPFVFEGDGSAFCVPPSLLHATQAALAKTAEVARESFALELRIATLPLARVREAGHDIRVARYRVSEHYVQAEFLGGGMAFADRFMKDPATAAQCAIDPARIAPEGSMQGLECRWEDLPSRHGETVSLMVKAVAADGSAVYRELIAKIAELYGAEDVCHPVSVPLLTPALGAKRLWNEVGVTTAGRGRLAQWLELMRVRWFVVLGWLLMKFGVRTEFTDWRAYKPALARNSDVRKFNDMYRQVLSGTAAQRERLEAWLADWHANGELVYGLHVTDRAHMTCLVFNYHAKHMHFIDGADGGLFLAAKAFKARAAALNTG